MNRVVTYYNNGAIQEAHRVIPKTILSRLHFDYFIGCDPVYAGLFNDEKTKDGRSYHITACVAYPYHQLVSKNLRKTTIVIPTSLPPVNIVHEIGHVLDEYLGFNHDAVPVTEYAKVDRAEAFAEAFTAWLYWGYASKPCKTASEIDDKTDSLLHHLMEGM